MSERGVVAMVMPRTGPTLLFAPYNYMALATDLKARGYEALILDERLDDVDAALLDPALRPRLKAVGLSSMMGPQLSYALARSAWVKEHLRGVPTIWGGIFPTELPEQTIGDPSVDYIVRGWGEGLLPDLLDRLAEGATPEGISGVVWTDSQGVIQLNDLPKQKSSEHPPLVYDWDSVDLSPFIMEGYGLGRRTVVMITSRGCPHHCTFCYGPQFHDSTWSGQSAEHVLEDVDHLAKRYDFDSIFFNDDNFAVKWSRTAAIAEGMAKRGLTYGMSFHASYLDDERIGFLKKTGCVRLYWGPESGSPRILNILKKGQTPEQNIAIAEAARKHDMGALMGFMVGHPQETEADLQMTLDHIDELMAIHPGMDISDIKIFTPYPGTEFYDDALAHGFKPPERLEDWSSFYWNKSNLPWLTQKQQDRLEIISYTSLCAFATWRTVGLNPLQNTIVSALNKAEQLRWRKRAFGYAPELLAIQKYVDLHRLDESLGRRAWNRLRRVLDRMEVR